METNTQFGPNYFRDLATLFGQFTCRDEGGAKLAFGEGVARFAERSVACRDRGGKIYFVGNGGSSGVVSHMAADFTKNGRIPGLTFTDNSLLTCVSNDLGYGNSFAEPFKIMGRPEDMLVAVSSSGQSPNILNVTRVALDSGCDVVTLSGFKADNPLRQMGRVR